MLTFFTACRTLPCVCRMVLICLGLYQSAFAQTTFISTENPHTREPIAYTEVTRLADGTEITKSFQPDGVLYLRKTGKVYQAQGVLPYVYKAAWFGIVPGKDCTEAFERLSKSLPRGTPIELRFELGRYLFSRPIVFKDVPIRMIGVNSWGWDANTTELYFSGTEGISFIGCHNGLLENLRIRGTGKGRGLYINSVFGVNGVSVSHFAKGVEIYGNIQGGKGSDASRGRYHNLSIAVCRIGLRIVGGDANQNSFYDLDIRDIDSVGLLESSFLGNSYYSSHFNNCKKGPIVVTDPNAVCTFYDAYGEEGQPAARITNNTQVVGNRLFCGVIGGSAQRGKSTNELLVDDLTIGTRLTLFNGYGGDYRFVRNKDGIWEFTYSNLDWTRVYLLKPGDVFRGKKVETLGFGIGLTGKIINIISGDK